MEEQHSSIFPEITISYASFWERFAAAFIDGLILIIPSYTIKYMIDGSLAGDGWGTWAPYLIQWLYYALLESGNMQATLGKRAMGIRVADLEGNRISFGRATGRYFGRILSAAILCIGYLMMLWDSKRQTLHDKLAGTIVIGR